VTSELHDDFQLIGGECVQLPPSYEQAKVLVDVSQAARLEFGQRVARREFPARDAVAPIDAVGDHLHAVLLYACVTKQWQRALLLESAERWKNDSLEHLSQHWTNTMSALKKHTRDRAQKKRIDQEKDTARLLSR